MEKAQEPRGEQGARPQAFVHGGLSLKSSLWPHSQMGMLKPEARKALPEPHPGSSAAPRCLTPAAGALTAAPSSAAPSAARAPCWETSQPSE